jgi:hypothetical protein
MQHNGLIIIFLQHDCMYYPIFCFSNHSWVSFSGFSEAYNDVYEVEIEKYASVFSNQIPAEGN